MFDKNINLIRGDSFSGKTEFLTDLANNLVDSGLKICFISTTETPSIRNNFTLYRSLSTIFEEDYKMLQLVSEIIIRDNYDYLFIDDIGSIFNDYHFKIKETDKLLEILINIPVKKILTCEFDESIDLPTKSKTSSNFFIQSSYNEYCITRKYDKTSKNIKTLISEVHFNEYELTTEVIKKTIRDIKIEKILK